MYILPNYKWLNNRGMAKEGGNSVLPDDAQLFQLLSHLVQEVESLTNEEEVELRSKIEALGLEVTKVPEPSSKHLDELEIAQKLDELSSKIENVDKMISSAMADDPDVKSLLCSTADVWMPVITASSDERRKFTGTIDDGSSEEGPKTTS